MSITLFKQFAQGMTDYIAKHNSNYSVIENQLNSILSVLTGQTGGGLEVSEGLKQIFDRKGIIGRDSYDFSEGSYPGETLPVSAGAYWSGSYYRGKVTSTTLSLTGKSSGTYYVYLDGTGTPALDSTAKQDTIRSFYWNATTKQVSNKQLYTGVSILFDGDDYADMLTSAIRGKTYTRVADRLEEIEASQDVFSGYYAQNLPHSGLNFRYQAGKVRNDAVITDTPAGQVTLTDNATNYVEVNPADGAVSANTTGFTSGRIPLYQVITSNGAITTVADKRTPAIAGTGGGGSGHTQNTDTGTTSDTFTIDMDAAGTTGRAGIEVENGDNPNAMLKFNRDTGHWEYSEDGGETWRNLGHVDLSQGTQEFSRYVGWEDPPEVYYASGRGSSGDEYEVLNLTPYLGELMFGAKAVLLRVWFRDSAPDFGVRVVFRPGGSFSPTTAYAVWSDESEAEVKPADLLIPPGIDNTVEFRVYASGEDTAVLQIFLLGYFEAVYGVGTQDKALTRANLQVAANSTGDFTLDDFCNRGLVHYLKVEETSGLPSGAYDLHLYADSSLTTLLYKAEGILPAQGPFEDWLPFWVYDAGGQRKLRVRIVNRDLSHAGTYTVMVQAEQFA